jgi:hypothetical protein
VLALDDWLRAGAMEDLHHLDLEPTDNKMGIPTKERSMAEPNVSHARRLVPDERGRITLGELAKGVSSFIVTEEGGVITLRPMVEIPRSALWAQSFEPLNLSADEAAAVHGLLESPPEPAARLKAELGKRTKPR